MGKHRTIRERIISALNRTELETLAKECNPPIPFLYTDTEQLRKLILQHAPAESLVNLLSRWADVL